ncbi:MULTISPECIES: hypothetical protein [unclassified Shewanella]|uniref:hypothetical protein n=1 Tax=unclassified Shewanella TaxID=196818 RepID=UPI001BC74446|nr:MULTISPECIES: hypothetical protein [unclassified Shewanella]GIU10812.1 hypothetical protein TUM4444_15690 [Shewanella sp. MBTL60-112-B1]GIU32941.1 hypothetical protein TUM4445_19290 [Shewanella sp. MBTL60-112-B2]
MAEMTNPMDSLRLLQQAINVRSVSFQNCESYPEVSVLYDTPNDTARFTYALFNGDIAQSIALFVLTEPVEGIPCFQMGWATIENERGKGLATNIVSKGLEELKNGMKRNGISKFFIEAVISESNSESVKLASKVFTEKPSSCTDSFSGDNALQFLQVA